MQIIQYQDIDVYGTENADGSPKQYLGVNAIKNALYCFLSSKAGDYLMSPRLGGILDRMIFKSMTPDNLENIKTILKLEVEESFPHVMVESVFVEADYVNYLTQVTVYYSIPSEGVLNESIDVFYDTEFSTNSFSYETIDYQGEQLLNFVQLKKPEFPNSRLIFDHDGGFWKWGKYKLVGLSVGDTDTFEALLILANT